MQSLLDVVRPGDYVKAKVLNNSIPYQLTLKEPDLGVVEAYCSVCGGLLYRSGDVLVCSLCGNREKRKTSLSYIHEITEDSRAKYTVDYLTDISSASQAAELMSVEFGNDTPLKLTYELSGGGRLVFYVAPREE